MIPEKPFYSLDHRLFGGIRGDIQTVPGAAPLLRSAQTAASSPLPMISQNKILMHKTFNDVGLLTMQLFWNTSA